MALVNLLVKQYPALLTQTTNEGYTALHIAVSHKHFVIVEILIDAYINLYRSRSTSGALPASMARVRAVTMTTDAPSLLMMTGSGHTPIHLAVAMNQVDVIQSLLKYQKLLSLSLEQSGCGYTALHLAVHLNLLPIVTMLLSNGASPNSMLMKDVASLAKTPLSEATINNDLEMTQLLIKHGGDDRRHDALSYALSQDSSSIKPEMIPLLLGSLIKVDESVAKPFIHSQSRKEGGKVRYKMALIDWNGIDMEIFKPEWIHDSLDCCMFFKAQNLSAPFCFNYINQLNVSRNKLKYLPLEFFHLPNLTILNVSHNELQSLPHIDRVPAGADGNQMVWPCPVLSKLNISKNQLTEAPLFLFELPRLSNLDLSHNRLVSLPVTIWSAPKLNVLNCSHNKIKEIPTNLREVMDTYQFIDIAAPVSPSQSMKYIYSCLCTLSLYSLNVIH